jgi:hypothetical protein
LSNEFAEPANTKQKTTKRARATAAMAKSSRMKKSLAVDRRLTAHKWQKAKQSRQDMTKRGTVTFSMSKPRDKKYADDDDGKSSSAELSMWREEIIIILNEIVVSDEELRNRVFAGVVLGELFKMRRKGLSYTHATIHKSSPFSAKFSLWLVVMFGCLDIAFVGCVTQKTVSW